MKALRTKGRILSLAIAAVVALTMVFGGSTAVFAGSEMAAGQMQWSYYVGGAYNSEDKQTPPAYYNGDIYFVTQHNGNSYLQKISENVTAGDDKKVTGEQLTTLAEMNGKLIHQATIPPTIDASAGKVYVPLTGCIAIIPLTGGAPVYVDTAGGYTTAGQQAISPVTYDSDYIYAATWVNSSTGSYYRISKSTLEKTVMKTGAGFYWAGAAPVNTDNVKGVVFGSDAQEVYLYSNGDSSVKDTLDVQGQVRSSMVPDGQGNYYFSSKVGFSSGYLYKIYVSGEGKLTVAEGFPVALTGGSTCTPLISDGKIYVGTDKKTIDVFSADGTKVPDAGCTAPGTVKSLVAVKGKVYAPNNKLSGARGGLINADGSEFFTPDTAMQQSNIYSIAANDDGTMLYFKNDSGYLMAVATGEKAPVSGDDEPALPEKPEKTEPADVYVTIADKGELMVTQEKIRVTDIDGDGQLTVNDTLIAAHEEYYQGGAAAGYGSAEQSWGLSITKLWGDTSGSFGYWVNNVSANSLADPVKDGDYINAFVYKDGTGWSDKYCWFDKETAETQAGGSVELTLSTVTGYDADKNWSPITGPVAGAKITINGEPSEYVTDENGKVIITFDEKGEYVISAVSDDLILVPPVCTVTVNEKAAGGDDPDSAVKTSDDFNYTLCVLIMLAAAATAVITCRRRTNN